MKPLAIDLFCGLGGWAEGLLAAGWEVIGFDVERHAYGPHRYPAQLVLQDVLTLHGSQFREADLIVASPPCQEYSYMAMPWKRAKAKAEAIRADLSGKKLADLTRLFNACFRIAGQASLAAGRHVPLIVENVRGAQPWVGRARWNYGSFYLWGDVPALMPVTGNRLKGGTTNWHDFGKPGYHGVTLQDHFVDHIKVGGIDWSKGGSFNGTSEARLASAIKNNGGSWFAVAHNTTSGNGQNPDGRKVPGGGADGRFGGNDHELRQGHSSSPRRKAASALIAKIPFPLARHIGRAFLPQRMAS